MLCINCFYSDNTSILKGMDFASAQATYKLIWHDNNRQEISQVNLIYFFMLKCLS